MKIDIEGIVIKQNPYKEKDAMVSVLTKDGIVSFLARSILSITSKNKSCCLPFSYSQFTLNSKQDKLSLSQGKLLKSYYHFFESLDCLASINLIDECIVKFVDEENTVLFDYLKNFLDLLDQGFDETTLTLIMLAQILKCSGYDLEYNSCVLCSSKTNIVGVSYHDGGFVCKKCFNNFSQKLNREALKTYRYIFMVPSDMMDHHIINKEIGMSFILNFCDYLMNSFGFKEIKALEIYKTTKR